MPTPEEAKRRAESTYDSAADSFDAPALGFWDYFGRRTVEQLGLQAGERVLDVACGSGASAIPAARDVGPQGSVLGVDLSENLLELAQAKASRANLHNLQFKKADMLALDLPDRSFDAVICVFGIFFIPDIVGAARELWRLVKPAGKLSITTWGESLFEPANTIFWNAIAQVRPELTKAFNHGTELALSQD